MFATFLSQLPKPVCLDCLTEIYAATDASSVRARLGELGDTVQVVEAPCGNCERRTTTYRVRQH